MAYAQYEQIDIWKDSPQVITATNGLTPWGYYDDDSAFQIDAYNFSKFAARWLGYPIIDIELQDINFYTAFEDAVNEYANQVNQFNIKSYLFSLQGLPTASIQDGNLTHKHIASNLTNTMLISSQYGTEVGLGPNAKWYAGEINIVMGEQDYDLTPIMEAAGGEGFTYEVRRVFHEAPPAIVRYFDPYVGTALANANLMESFGWGGMSPAINFMMMPLYGDILRIQAIEMNDQVRKSAYSFDIKNNVLKVFPVPSRDYTTYFQFVKVEEKMNPFMLGRKEFNSYYGKNMPTGNGLIADFSNIPYMAMSYGQINYPGKQWIRQYALGSSKEMLGMVRSKYAQIPGPNENVTLDGDTQRSEGAAMKADLITKLREMLEATTQTEQLKREQEKATAMVEILNKIPLPIIVA